MSADKYLCRGISVGRIGSKGKKMESGKPRWKVEEQENLDGHPMQHRGRHNDSMEREGTRRMDEKVRDWS